MFSRIFSSIIFYSNNILCDSIALGSPHKQFFGSDPKYLKHLRIFGEIGIVANLENKKIRGKQSNRGKPCMFTGYAENHAGDVYRFINFETAW